MWDFDYHMVGQAKLTGQSFHSLVMAAMIRADSTNRRRLVYAFPMIAGDLFERGHAEIPVEPRPERGDQRRPGSPASPGADVYDPLAALEQIQEAMGDISYELAPRILEILFERHGELMAAAAREAAVTVVENWTASYQKGKET